MARKIILTVMALLAVLLVVLAANTLLTGAPPLGGISAAGDIPIDKDSAAQRLAEAIRFRTVSHGPDTPVDAGALLGLHDHFERSFPNVHAALKREVVGGYSLLYTWKGTDPNLKPVLLNAHMDVVPVEPGTEGDWMYPPFSGAIADGSVWGRGAMDMKVSLMGILEAVEFLLAQGFMPEQTVYLAFGHDEEIGGANGAAKIAELLAKRAVRLDFTLDEGLVIAHNIVPGVAKPVALIGVAEKGYLTVELAAHAEGGHSSKPPSNTAIGKLARAIYRLETNPMPVGLRAPVSDMFDYLTPEMPFMRRMVLANRWLFEPLILSQLEKRPATNALIRTTTAPTVIEGGVKENVLPTEARALVNFRILPGDTVEKVLEHVLATIDDRNVAVRQVGAGRGASPFSDIGSESFAALEKTVRQVFPDAVVAPGLVLGGTDSKHYAKIADNSYRILPMRLGPGDIKRIHGTGERVSIENYAEIIRFYVQLLRNTQPGAP